MSASFQPTTRHSLLLRLHDRQDHQAWLEFVEIYEPLIYRLARRRGFQDADAKEIAQEVLFAVNRSIERFTPGQHAGSFRGWLARITKNLVIDRFRSEKSHNQRFHPELGQPIANSRDKAVLENAEQIASIFEWEHRRQVFYWAADQLRHRYNERTWLAFWRTCVAGESVEQVARELSMTTGAIYVARCRIIARLREIVALHSNQEQAE